MFSNENPRDEHMRGPSQEFGDDIPGAVADEEEEEEEEEGGELGGDEEDERGEHEENEDGDEDEDEDEDDPRGTMKFPSDCRVILDSLQRFYPQFAPLDSLFQLKDAKRRQYMAELTEDVVTTLLEVPTLT